MSKSEGLGAPVGSNFTNNLQIPHFGRKLNLMKENNQNIQYSDRSSESNSLSNGSSGKSHSLTSSFKRTQSPQSITKAKSNLTALTQLKTQIKENDSNKSNIILR